jgi:hypothetical protein
MFSSFPYNWFVAAAMRISIFSLEDTSIVGNSYLMRAPRLIRLLKIARMLKMLKLLRIFKV